MPEPEGQEHGLHRKKLQSYKGFEEHFRVCELRSRCIRKSGTKVRQVTKIMKGVRHQKKNATPQMIEQLDSECGRYYNRGRKLLTIFRQRKK